MTRLEVRSKVRLEPSSTPSPRPWRGKRIHRPWYHLATPLESRSGQCAFVPPSPQRIYRILRRERPIVSHRARPSSAHTYCVCRVFPGDSRWKRDTEHVPLMKSVSPVNTTRSSPSSMNQQMLSCVWQGVWSGVTLILPIASSSLWPGVSVTRSQSFPPQTGSCGVDRA